MIQRKQTIFLVISLLAFVSLFIAPFASFSVGTVVTCYVGILGMQGGCEFSGFMFVIMQILTTLFMSLVGISIFMYKKRPLQIRLCATAFIINVFLVGTMFITTTIFSNTFGLSKDNPMSYLFPTYIPIITLLLVGAATRAIRKDEALTRSLNRLR
ncbi:MAG: DUF4293 domain-containing protein [Bacteroidales bacterium]|nr:DUF4293 domain-containing protein [Bacteroidales bacterium]